MSLLHLVRLCRGRGRLGAGEGGMVIRQEGEDKGMVAAGVCAVHTTGLHKAVLVQARCM